MTRGRSGSGAGVCKFIYAEGYIVFVFPFVRPYECSFVRDSVPIVELLQSFTFKFLKWGISHQPLIRKH